jgi:hypothetical protein
MRIIPTWIHGLLDYPMSILLIALPWLGGFANGGAPQWVSIVAGVAMLGLSAMTAYEAGLVRATPMSAHLMADAAMGLLLAASPWLFGFSDLVSLPFVVLGLGEIGAAVMTETRPGHRLSKTAF